MNYALDLSLRMERIFENLQSETASSNLRGSVLTTVSDGYAAGPTPGTYGLQYEGRAGDDHSVIPPYVAPPPSGAGTPIRTGTPRSSTHVFPSSPAGPETPSPPLPVTEDLEERALQIAMEEGSFGSPLSFFVSTNGIRTISVPGIRGTLPPLGSQRSLDAHWSHNLARRC